MFVIYDLYMSWQTNKDILNILMWLYKELSWVSLVQSNWSAIKNAILI